MKKYKNIIRTIAVCMSFLVYGCLQTSARNLTCWGHAESRIGYNKEDSLGIIKALKQLEKDPLFLKELGLSEQAHPASFFNEDMFRLFKGDVDGDGKGDVTGDDDKWEDALLLFSVEGVGGGNNWAAYYAYFKKAGNHWQYKGKMLAGTWSQALYFEVETIIKGEIKGFLKTGLPGDETAIAKTFVFKSGRFINTFTGLHSSRETDDIKEPCLMIENVLLPGDRLLPVKGTLKTYESILGKGKIEVPAEPPACGTYFEDNAIRYVNYPKMRFELNGQGEMVLVQIDLKGTGIKIQTNRGTIMENTAYDALFKALGLKEEENLERSESGSEEEAISDADADTNTDTNTNTNPRPKVLIIPTGPGSDNKWEIKYGNSCQIQSVSLFVPC